MRGYSIGFVLALVSLAGCEQKATNGGAASSASVVASSVTPRPSGSVPVAGLGWEEPAKEPLAALRVRTYAMEVRGELVVVGSEAGVTSVKYGGEKPENISSITLAGSVNGLSIVGEKKNLVVASTGPDGLWLLEMSEDGKLTQANAKKWTSSERNGCDSIWQVREGAGGEFYAACGASGVGVLDLSDRQHPRIVKRVETGGYVRDISVVEDEKGQLVKGQVVAAAGREGVVLVDIKGQKVSGKVGMQGEARGVEVKKGRAYVAGGADGLLIIDLSDRAVPKVIGRFDPKTTDMARSVSVSGNTGYLCLGDSGLMFLDVSEPSSVKRIGLIDPERAVNRVTVVGARLYAANDADGVMILDVGDVKNPRTIHPKKTAVKK